MLFSSIPFLFYFLPCVLIAYYLVPKPVKTKVLLLASLLFYGWGEPLYVFLMLGTIFIVYLLGLGIEKYRDRMGQKVCFWIAVSVSLGLLAFFKYADFFIVNVNRFAGTRVPLLKIALPIGISFYTFQVLSYIIDVYRGKVAVQKNFVTLATYITMFPQLIAGPIVRYADVERQLTDREIHFSKIAYGIRRFVLGLGKKVLIANVLGEFCVHFRLSEEKTLVLFWAYAIAVSLQIYFDFSGYSDMAIGLGSMLGFHFMENFNYPFISKSITEFWRRWHMSLGTWFRDYVYIPLGGSRCSLLRNLFNIFVVWMLTGFWHGAEWNFVIWGLYFGILLIIEKLFLLKHLEKHQFIGHVYVLFVTIISFVIFDAENLSLVFAHIKAMFDVGGTPLSSVETMYYLESYGLILLVAVIGATPLPKLLVEKLKANNSIRRLLLAFEPVFMVLLLLVVTAYLVDGSFNPFLYFRF